MTYLSKSITGILLVLEDKSPISIPYKVDLKHSHPITLSITWYQLILLASWGMCISFRSSPTCSLIHIILWYILRTDNIRATGAQNSRRILSDIIVCNYDTTHLQENPQRLGWGSWRDLLYYILGLHSLVLGSVWLELY